MAPASILDNFQARPDGSAFALLAVDASTRALAAHCHRYTNPGHYLGLGAITAYALSDWATAATRDGWRVFVRHGTRGYGTVVHARYCQGFAADIWAATSRRLLEDLRDIHRDTTGAV